MEGVENSMDDAVPEGRDDGSSSAGAVADERKDAPVSAASPRRARGRDLFAKDIGFGDDDSLGDHWSVPWSDVMMIMFVLFAALLAAKMMQPDIEIRYRAAPVPQINEVEIKEPVDKPVLSRQPSFEPLMQLNVLERSRDAVREMQLHNVDIALLDDQSVRVSVQGPMFFELGQADLQPEVREFLDRLARVIAQTPYEIHVIGHTDDYPINTELFPSNWELSLVRASRVARHLISASALDPARFVVMGRSQYAPAHPNANDTTRALNRRVEIIITREVATTASEERI